MRDELGEGLGVGGDHVGLDNAASLMDKENQTNAPAGSASSAAASFSMCAHEPMGSQTMPQSDHWGGGSRHLGRTLTIVELPFTETVPSSFTDDSFESSMRAHVCVSTAHVASGASWQPGKAPPRAGRGLAPVGIAGAGQLIFHLDAPSHQSRREERR